MAKIWGILFRKWWLIKIGDRSPHHKQTTENSFISVVLGLVRIAIPTSIRLTNRDRIGGIR